MATLGMALNNMSEELAESYSVLERRVQEKTAGPGAEKRDPRLPVAGQPPTALERAALRAHFARSERVAGANPAARY
jgi:nitrate/nitrite-specific signal transduction histidine kinase